jgi:hypothetical protein
VGCLRLRELVALGRAWQPSAAASGAPYPSRPAPSGTGTRASFRDGTPGRRSGGWSTRARHPPARSRGCGPPRGRAPGAGPRRVGNGTGRGASRTSAPSPRSSGREISIDRYGNSTASGARGVRDRTPRTSRPAGRRGVEPTRQKTTPRKGRGSFRSDRRAPRGVERVVGARRVGAARWSRGFGWSRGGSNHPRQSFARPRMVGRAVSARGLDRHPPGLSAQPGQ